MSQTPSDSDRPAAGSTELTEEEIQALDATSQQDPVPAENGAEFDELYRELARQLLAQVEGTVTGSQSAAAEPESPAPASPASNSQQSSIAPESELPVSDSPLSVPPASAAPESMTFGRLHTTNRPPSRAILVDVVKSLRPGKIKPVPGTPEK
jgi:hypothetical protein